MTILILDTALPLVNGTPRQRSSAARLDFFAVKGPVRHFCIDIHGSEIAFRFHRNRGDRLIGRLPLSEVLSETSAASLQDMKAGWLSPGRLARLERTLVRFMPSEVVIGDPLLFPLLSALEVVRCPMHLFDDASSIWHDRARLRQTSPLKAEYHNTLASLSRQGTELFKRVRDLQLHVTPAYIFPDNSISESKMPSVVTVASGYPSADHQTLALLDRIRTMLQSCSNTQAEHDILAVGFDETLMAEFPEINGIKEFTHFAGLAGTAACVFLPWLSPEIVRLAQAILLAGTPVVTLDTEIIPPELAGSAGLIVTSPQGLASTLELLLDMDLMDVTRWRAVAVSEQARLLQIGRQALQCLIPAPRRKLHTQPLVEPPEIFYNTLSQMLLVRLKWRQGSPVEEVRLLDDEGTELIRLMPNAHEKKRSPVALEGGVVISLKALGATIVIELYDNEMCLEVHRIPVKDFIVFEAELAWLKREDGLISGAFWVVQDIASSRWSIASNGIESEVSVQNTIPMPEVGGNIMPFSTVLGLAPKAPVTLNRWLSGSVSCVETVEQRPLFPTSLMINPQKSQNTLLENLRNIHAGKRGWIIGNGPSVRTEDLSRIPQDDVTFCFNRFYMSYDQHSLREDYVVSADFLMIQDFGQEMIDVSTGLPLFCTRPAAMPALSGTHVVLTPFDSYLPLFSMAPSEWVSVGGSSVYVALQMAFFMGLRDIVLYGLDYSFSMKLKRDPRYPFPVSYDEGNHFIASYRSAKPWCPPTWRDISGGFLNARVAFESHGGRITNATRGGKLTTFPRADFDRLVPRKVH